jgi:DNA-binding MarR family transcriptional regulator
VNPDEIIEKFLNSLEKFYTFLRPHASRYRTAVKRVGGIKKNERVELDMWHFSALVIISLLTNKGEKACLQDELEGVFLWKYADKKNKFVDRKNGVLNVLDSCGFIIRNDFEEDLRKNTISLTKAGREFINNELRESRRPDVLTIISQIGIREPDKYPYGKVIKEITDLADNLWSDILIKAKELQDKEKATKKLQQQRKKLPA